MDLNSYTGIQRALLFIYRCSSSFQFSCFFFKTDYFGVATTTTTSCVLRWPMWFFCLPLTRIHLSRSRCGFSMILIFFCTFHVPPPHTLLRIFHSVTKIYCRIAQNSRYFLINTKDMHVYWRGPLKRIYILALGYSAFSSHVTVLWWFAVTWLRAEIRRVLSNFSYWSCE